VLISAVMISIVISLIDLGANLMSLIPGVGDLLETGSETLLELIQNIIFIAASLLMAYFER